MSKSVHDTISWEVLIPTFVPVADAPETFNGTIGAARAGPVAASIQMILSTAAVSLIFSARSLARLCARPHQSSQQPQGYQQEVDIAFQEAFEGTTRQLQTNGRKLQVRIPAGVKTGSKVRVAGAGPEGLDLYLIVNITDEDKFERNGQDLYTTSTLSVFTLILGGETDVETPTGKVKLSIPAGTQTDQVFRLAGRGMPHLKNPNTKGDLFVKLKVQVPKYLSSKQRELLEEASLIKF